MQYYQSFFFANYARICGVFWKKLHSRHTFYTTVGRDGRDKSQLWTSAVWIVSKLLVSTDPAVLSGRNCREFSRYLGLADPRAAAAWRFFDGQTSSWRDCPALISVRVLLLSWVFFSNSLWEQKSLNARQENFQSHPNLKNPNMASFVHWPFQAKPKKVLN